MTDTFQWSTIQSFDTEIRRNFFLGQNSTHNSSVYYFIKIKNEIFILKQIKLSINYSSRIFSLNLMNVIWLNLAR